MRIVDGNQSSGKVLTSDASGNASTQHASNGTVVAIRLARAVEALTEGSLSARVADAHHVGQRNTQSRIG